VRHHNKPRRGRAHGASADDLFQNALFGEDASDRRAFDPRSDRKTLQLCRQVFRALSLALAGDGDDLLRDVQVGSVEPMGTASQLLVAVLVPRSAGAVSEVMARLESRAPALRAEVARSICRKRVPMLSFIAVPMEQEGAVHD
jgi:hypothetical protein